MNVSPDAYPVRLDIDYPESLDRLKTACRIILAIPIIIVIGLLSGGSASFGDTDVGWDASLSAAGAGVLFLPVLLLLVFRQRYPVWWFDWNLAFSRFGLRVAAYLMLLTDQYPSTEDHQSAHLDIDYPDAMQLNRWLPLVKWFLAIPHYIILIALSIAAVVVVVLAWFAILFTGRYPAGMFAFVVGVLRWHERVAGYAFLLVTDRYPPFSLQ